jgi:hypothetical protein
MVCLGLAKYFLEQPQVKRITTGGVISSMEKNARRLFF